MTDKLLWRRLVSTADAHRHRRTLVATSLLIPRGASCIAVRTGVDLMTAGRDLRALCLCGLVFVDRAAVWAPLDDLVDGTMDPVLVHAFNNEPIYRRSVLGENIVRMTEEVPS